MGFNPLLISQRSAFLVSPTSAQAILPLGVVNPVGTVSARTAISDWLPASIDILVEKIGIKVARTVILWLHNIISLFDK